MYQVVIKQLA